MLGERALLAGSIVAALTSAALMYTGGYRHAAATCRAERAEAAAAARETETLWARSGAASLIRWTDQNAERHANAEHTIAALRAELAAIPACPLPGAVRRLHDRAAGVPAAPPDAAAPGGPGEAVAATAADGVEAAVVIESCAANYAICRDNAAQLTSLQEWYWGLAGSRPAHGGAEDGRD